VTDESERTLADLAPVLRHAARDIERIEERIAEATQHIHAELQATNGAVQAQRFTEGGRSAEQTTVVEATVIARDELADRGVSIVADSTALFVHVDEVDKLVRRLFSTCARAIGIRVPLPVDRCHSDPGLAGYLVPLSEGGWFDPLCSNAPRSPAARSASGAQCDKCRMACARWRALNGQPALADEREVKYDSKVASGELGVFHAKPVAAA
jgi:hypothetical protein